MKEKATYLSFSRDDACRIRILDRNSTSEHDGDGDGDGRGGDGDGDGDGDGSTSFRRFSVLVCRSFSCSHSIILTEPITITITIPDSNDFRSHLK